MKPSDLIAIYMTNSPDFCFALLGAWAIGAAPALINSTLEGDALVHCLRVAGVKLLLLGDDVDCVRRVEASRHKCEELGLRIITLSQQVRAEINATPSERPPDSLRSEIDTNSPILLLYTSGSTGYPKACAMPVRSNFSVWTTPRIQALGLEPASPDGRSAGDRWYNCMPFYHGTGSTTILAVCQPNSKNGPVWH